MARSHPEDHNLSGLNTTLRWRTRRPWQPGRGNRRYSRFRRPNQGRRKTIKAICLWCGLQRNEVSSVYATRMNSGYREMRGTILAGRAGESQAGRCAVDNTTPTMAGVGNMRKGRHERMNEQCTQCDPQQAGNVLFQHLVAWGLDSL